MKVDGWPGVSRELTRHDAALNVLSETLLANVKETQREIAELRKEIAALSKRQQYLARRGLIGR